MGAYRRIASMALVATTAAAATAVAWSVTSAYFDGKLGLEELVGRRAFLWAFAVLAAAYVLALVLSRRARAATLVALSVAAVVTITLCVSLDADKYSPRRTDVTFARVNELSDQTLRVIAALPRQEKVEVTALMKPLSPEDYLFDRRVKELLDEYEAAGKGSIEVRHLDLRVAPDRAKFVAKELGLERVEANSVIFSVGRGPARRRKDVGRRDMEADDYTPGGPYLEPRLRFFGEEAFTGALLAIMEPNPARVYFLTGHGERDIQSFEEEGYGQWADYLGRKGFEVAGALRLVETKEIPGDCAVLIVAGPKSPIGAEELQLIRKYIDDGGPALFLIEPAFLTAQTGLAGFLAQYGVAVGNDLVMDKGRFMRSELNPAMSDYPAHAITQKLKGTYTTVFDACSVEGKATGGPGGAYGIRILQSSEDSWAERDLEGLSARRVPIFDEEEDRAGPVGLAVALAPPAGERRVAGVERVELRVVVIGDADIAAGLGLEVSPTNKEFLLNVMNWLRRQEKLISIPAKDVDEPLVMMDSRDRKKMGLLAILGLPLAAIIAGGLVWFARNAPWR